MKKYTELSVSFLTGAVIYSIIEIMWRGHTHWTMAVAGGICLAVIYVVRSKCSQVSLLLRCITGAVFICAVEFTVGFIVNLVLGWNVWDYSDRAFNLYGQICPAYAFLWFLICIPANIISAVLHKMIMLLPFKNTNNT